MKEMMPTYDEVKLNDDIDNMSIEERRKQLWDHFEEVPKI